MIQAQGDAALLCKLSFITYIIKQPGTRHAFGITEWALIPYNRAWREHASKGKAALTTQEAFLGLWQVGTQESLEATEGLSQYTSITLPFQTEFNGG